MFDFSPYADLPLLAGGVIAAAIFLYVLLDGFDLGVGILFPFAPSDACRNMMMSSIAPFWDGNETWLVLGGGGLLAAFPLAYSIVLPAFYIPILLMLLGLIFRGVAFEFRFKAKGRMYAFWGYVFHFGSLGAAFFQGVILGAFVKGIRVSERAFAGGAFDWLDGFSLATGAGLVFGYTLLGATWTLMKTEGKTKSWARKAALYSLIYVAFMMGIVSLWVPFLSDKVFIRWFSYPNFCYLAPIPLLTASVLINLYLSLLKGHTHLPFGLSFILFALGYAGLAVSLWPYVVPYQLTVWEAAADPKSLSLVLTAVFLLLPFTLGYTAYVYYVFRGKAKAYYHE